MNLKYLFPIVVFLLLVIFTLSYLNELTNKKAYLEEIETKRLEIIDFMKNDPKSPFLVKGETKFEGLNFFEIDPEFRVKAKIELIPSPIPINIQMSEGKTAEYFKYALAYFVLDDVEQKLHLFKSRQFFDEPWLFLPFYDETSAVESYGGGRYLNVEFHNDKEVILDFNLAYNPYCAYSDDYSCPIPPIENRVTVKVSAGERNYKAYH